MKGFVKTIVLIVVSLFLNYYSYSQVKKIVLIREGGGEFRKERITITLQKTDWGWDAYHQPEEYPLYSIRENVCGLCRTFKSKAIKEKKIIQKTDFDKLVNAIESLNINELEKNNNLYSFLHFPPTIKLELYENDVNTFSFQYVSASVVPDFPTSLQPLNTIAKDIFKLAGIKSKKYCVK
jgi:hypothetical protein